MTNENCVKDDSGELKAAVRVLARLARGVEIVCQKSDLSLSQYRLLVFIGDTPQRASELASRAAISKPTLTSLIDGLVERGLAKREQVEGDRRGISLEVTSAGQKALKRADEYLVELMSALTAEDKKGNLVAGLLTLAEVLKKEEQDRLLKIVKPVPVGAK